MLHRIKTVGLTHLWVLGFLCGCVEDFPVYQPPSSNEVDASREDADAPVFFDRGTASLDMTVMSFDLGRLDQRVQPVQDSRIEVDINPPEDALISPDVLTHLPDVGMSTETDVAPPVVTNLLVDPSFEANGLAWGIYGGASRVESRAQDGAWSVRIARRSGAEQRVEGLVPNARYRLSGWGLSEDEEPVVIGVKGHGFPQAVLGFDTEMFTDGAMTFSTGFGTTSAVIFVYKHEGSSVGFVDNLALTYEGPADTTPIWSDEFDGSGPLDSTRWGFESGFVRNEELQWYQRENAFRENGHLVIEGRQERRPNPNYDPQSTDWRTRRAFIEYTAASVNTKERFSFQYGRLVVRAKVTNEDGTWPAIWTLGTQCEWPSNGEVDVMENYGGDILANFAWGTNGRWQPEWDVVRRAVANFDANWTDRFHIWELVWTENRMQILLDGQLLNEVDLNRTINGNAACSGENPFRQPHYLLLNLALGGNGGDLSGTPFPTRYLIDYVRLYE